MDTIKTILQAYGFNYTFYVEGREAIADLLPKTRRCGIYVLHFNDGMHYVGKSTDVTRRYVEHRRNYNDIIEISFKKVKKTGLDFEERRIRSILQDSGYTLRGVVGVYLPPGGADFDLIMSIDEQFSWLNNPETIDFSGSRMTNPALRKTYENRHQRFLNQEVFSEVLRVLKKYVKLGIPRIRATEASFWSCSCWPMSTVYTRININWQEVFSANKGPNKLGYSFQMALSPLDDSDLIREYFDQLPAIPLQVGFQEDEYIVMHEERHDTIVGDAWKSGLLRFDYSLYDAVYRYVGKYEASTISSYRYGPGGDDQINFFIQGTDNALSLLDDETIIKAIRKLNLRLMRSGPCNFSGSHCLSLADLIVEP